MVQIQEKREFVRGSAYVVPVSEYQSPASRIAGFQELHQLDLTVPTPMFVLGHEAFRSYLKNGELPEDVRRDITSAFGQIRAQNPNRGAYIGRAFYVPGIDNPNGPRTAAIYDQNEYIRMVEKFYQFVIDHGYDKTEGIDIALILHPFINVMDRRSTYGRLEIPEEEILPFSAGYAVPDPVPGQASRIKIVATFGPDEAIQSCPSDEYDVDPEKDTIIRKSIALKDVTFVPQTGDMYAPLPVPERFQKKQALTDSEILAVSGEVQKVLRHRPQSRVEFICQEDGVYVREIAPWEPVDEHILFKLANGQEVVAPVVRVESLADAGAIPTDAPAIVYFGPGAFRQRTTDIFAQVAHNERSAPLVALVHGTVTTSHMARILVDAGISVVHVGETAYETGEYLRISRRPNGEPHVEFVDPYEHATVRFDHVKNLQYGEAGQKVRRLALMRHYGIPVPDGFGLTSDAIWQWIRSIGLSDNVARLDTIDLNQKQVLDRLSETIQSAIRQTELPLSLQTQILVEMESFGFPCFAVRSSGSEDGETRSLAGLYVSQTDVRPGDVPAAIRETVASYFSPLSIRAVRRMDMSPSHMTIGVGVHEYIPDKPGTIGFVAFTYPSSLQIDAVSGSPESLVGGIATDYLHIHIDREQHTVTLTPKGTSDVQFTNEQQNHLAAILLQIEKIFDSYQDIEGVIDPDRGILIVQARPR